MMINDERIVEYIHSLEHTNSPLLCDLEKYAHDNNVPIIRKSMESFLRVMIAIKRPSKILEVGTAIGYSAILMAESMPQECTLTTIENYDRRIALAKENFGKSSYSDRIRLIEGDAALVLAEMKEEYDFIFMDAAKGQYINFLPDVTRILKKDGVLITDNIFQDGDLVNSRYSVERRDRTIHARMREYVYTLKNSEEYETSIVPIGDGITLSIKR